MIINLSQVVLNSVQENLIRHEMFKGESVYGSPYNFPHLSTMLRNTFNKPQWVGDCCTIKDYTNHLVTSGNDKHKRSEIELPKRYSSK